MNYSRPIVAALLILIAAVLSAAQPGSNDRDAAIRTYREGNDLAAILALEPLVKQKQYSSDAELINYLGLAYQNSYDQKKARKMFEKAVKLQPQNSAYRVNLAYCYLLERKIDRSQQLAKKALELDPSNLSAYYVLGKADLWERKTDSSLLTAEKMISLEPGLPLGYALKSEGLIAKLGERLSGGATVKAEIGLLKDSVEVLEAGIKNSRQPGDAKGLEERMESMRVFYEHYSKDRSLPPGTAPVPEPGVTPFKILSKPRARYTDSARSANVQGSILVAVLLGANGRIVHILKLKGLGYGLDEEAIRAASQIRFTPKMKDGAPVSTVQTFEYTFSIY
jgi:TonB family protein